MGSEGGYYIGFSDKTSEVNEGEKVEGRSLVDFLGVEIGTEVGPCDGMSDGRDVGEL